ncbi:MAG: hypothetical protein MHMPM18_003740 [Marteilia pararefringens]
MISNIRCAKRNSSPPCSFLCCLKKFFTLTQTMIMTMYFFIQAFAFNYGMGCAKLCLILGPVLIIFSMINPVSYALALLIGFIIGAVVYLCHPCLVCLACPFWILYDV